MRPIPRLRTNPAETIPEGAPSRSACGPESCQRGGQCGCKLTLPTGKRPGLAHALRILIFRQGNCAARYQAFKAVRKERANLYRDDGLIVER